MTEFLILTRAVHFGACLLFFGVFAFDRFIVASIFKGRKIEVAAYWQSWLRRLNLISLPAIFLSGAAWFILVAINMSGQPLSNTVLKLVWMQTEFGTVWKIRLALWLAAAIIFALFYFSKPPTAFQKILLWLQLFFAVALLGSLAWAGHGQEGSRWHLFADVLHLLAAGFWPTGLLPLFLLLRKLSRIFEAGNQFLVAGLVARFSAMSLICVSLLAATGFVNGWFLVGSFSNLIGQTYGRWLLAKIIFFCIAVGFGAVNLLKLKPRLQKNIHPQNVNATLAQLQFNIRAELFFGTAIVVVVAVLGILPPAIH